MRSEISDKELLQSIAAGDEQAFQLLFDRYWENLFSFVYRLTGDESHTKDILQDVFLYTWENRDTLHVDDSLLPYLITVTRSHVMSAFRKDKVRLKGADVLLATIERYASVDEQLLFKELQHKVDGELSKMPFNMRQCFQLSRFEDRSIREIAAELCLSEQTVKNNISEALRRLRLATRQGALLSLILGIMATVVKG